MTSVFDLLSDIFTGDPERSETHQAVSNDPGSRSTWKAQEFQDGDGEAVGAGLGYLKEWMLGEGVSATRGASATGGAWFDDEGDVNRGVRGDAHVLKLNQPEAWSTEHDDGVTSYGGWERSLLDAIAEATVDEGNGASLGAQANVASAAVSTGTRGTATDEQARLGLSLGVGAAGRLHWGDADNDQRPEYGFGFDVGPVSADLKTEDPVRKMLELGSLGMFGGGPPTTDRANLTEGVVDAGRAVGSGASAISDAISGVEGTQGTRGGTSTFGQMGEAELTVAALFNDGMNPEVRRAVMQRRRDDALQFLFGGSYD